MLKEYVVQKIEYIKNILRTKEAKYVLILLLSALILRLILTPIMHGHPTDINNFKAWSLYLVKLGLDKFYTGVWCDYPPGYMYVLWVIGNLYKLFDPNFVHWSGMFFTILVKLPGILAEVINIGLIFYIIRKYTSFNVAIFFAIIYALQPAMIFESAFWGQMDSVIFLFQLLSIIALINGNNILAIFLTAVGIFIKPQGLILLPLILFVIIKRKAWLDILVGGTLSFLFAHLFTLPFTKEPTLIWLFEHYLEQAKLYPYSAIQTFNLWSFTGLWKPDSRLILGIPHSTWGIIIFSIVYISILIYLHIKHKKESNSLDYLIIHSATLIMIAFFLFPTRMHERYLFSGVSFLTISAALHFRWRIPYYILSISFLINNLYELPGVKDGFPAIFKHINGFLSQGIMFNENFGLFWYTPITILNLFLFGYLLFLAWKYSSIDIKEEDFENISRKIQLPKQSKDIKANKYTIPSITNIDKIDRIIILVLVLLSSWIKLYNLDYPPELVFDEVYHARAGGEYLNGIHPLEWVHPPLSKLLIAVAIYFYDMNSFGWRIMPLIASIIIIPFLYILAKNVFNNRYLALIGTGLFTLDGVYFVQSRIAMTNIFAILFQVMALTFFFLYLKQEFNESNTKKKYYYFIASGISIALALSCRWTSLWAWGFIILCLLWIYLIPSIKISPKQSFNFKNILTYIKEMDWNIELKPFKLKLLGLTFLVFFCIPFVIYFSTYLPYMITHHHSLWDAMKMQVGIWQYHAQLRDPHPYYSEWYTWPFLVRPTWYYFESNEGIVRGIIALGNPAIWWAIVPAFLFTIWQGVKNKRIELVYIALAFFFLYIMWGISPRIKNFSHYLLEAVPYACLCITYCIKELWQKNLITKYIVGLYLFLVIGLFIFFYPLYSAYPISEWYFRAHIWFRSWI